MSPQELIDFTKEVERRFENRDIRGPIHLNSETQIAPLLEVFKEIKMTDWVLSTWRSTYHALLHGVPRETVMRSILDGKSMQLHFPEYRFMSSSIMGGMLPIACGLAAGGKKVWCFVGDMCASTGAFQDALKYAQGHDLPVQFVVEDNGLSTNTPTKLVWGDRTFNKKIGYKYIRTTNHSGAKKYVSF